MVRTDLEAVLNSLSEGSFKDDRLTKMRDYLLYTYCFSLKHTPVVIKCKKEEVSFKIEELESLSKLIPSIPACEKLPCITALSQLIEHIAAQEKKVSKE